MVHMIRMIDYVYGKHERDLLFYVVKGFRVTINETIYREADLKIIG